MAIVQTVKGPIRIASDDANQIKEALLDYLRESNLEDKDYLLRMTEAVPAWIDPDGLVRIGAWLLQARGDSLVMTYRMPPGAPVVRAFAATVLKQDSSWVVTDFQEERIIPRR